MNLIPRPDHCRENCFYGNECPDTCGMHSQQRMERLRGLWPMGGK
jgi:hypothetical protein